MPEFEYGELYIHTDEENECNQILEKLLENGLLALKSVLEKENVETEGMLLNEKYHLPKPYSSCRLFVVNR